MHYKDIGRDLPDNNNFFFSIKLSTMRALLYDLALDRMANFCAKGAYISSHNSESLRLFEKRCANFIKQNDPGTAWLQRLTERWKKIKDKDSRVKDHVWCPDTSIVFAILENYAQIANSNGEDADIASHYIAQVKKAMEKETSYALEEKKKSPLVRIKYSMLGITEDNGHYVLVPLNILSKIIVI